MKTRILRLLAILPLAFACSARAAAPVEVTLDPNQTGEPISPYIYGQFTEHLGRCIYGGIWAEMLQDRKFYHPITAHYAPYTQLVDTPFPVVGASPWEIDGSAEDVTMTTDAPFVGEHTPEVRAGHGIRQHDLGVTAGGDYTGYIWVKPVRSGATDIEVSLAWGDGPKDRATKRLHFTGDYAKQPFSFHTAAANDHATFEIRVLNGDARIGTVSLMPADNVRGMRRDTLEKLKEMGGTIYRWPGGNFASGYDWHNGIGDRDRRPPKTNPAWTGVEHNDFGTDEFLDFCHEVGTEPMICVNTGFGDAYTAAEWVQYCNGKADTLAGGWRARNGHPQPYAVKHWCVGNEMFGPWQLGFMQLYQYVAKHNEVAREMHKVDPSLVLVGVGAIEQINKDYDPEQVKRGINWSQGMLESCSANMNLLSEHLYAGRLPWKDNGRAPLLAAVTQVKDAIHEKVEAHRKLQPTIPQLHGKLMPLSFDEYNYWHRDYVYGELGCVYDLADTLGIAEALNEFSRDTDLVQAACYAQAVNVIGAVKTSKTAAELEGTGLVLQLYRHHFGTLPLRVRADLAPLDIAAALSSDRRTLTIAIVNPTSADAPVQLRVPGLNLGKATRYVITGANEYVHNAPGEPRQIDIKHSDGFDGAAPLVAPPLSCALFEIALK